MNATVPDRGTVVVTAGHEDAAEDEGDGQEGDDRLAHGRVLSIPNNYSQLALVLHNMATERSEDVVQLVRSKDVLADRGGPPHSQGVVGVVGHEEPWRPKTTAVEATGPLEDAASSRSKPMR